MTNHNPRRKPPTYVLNHLWSESFGHCTNPGCQRNLYQGNQKIAETAHIIPHSHDGDVSFEILIMLCPNCDTTYETTQSTANIELMKHWKYERRWEIDQRFQSICE